MTRRDYELIALALSTARSAALDAPERYGSGSDVRALVDHTDSIARCVARALQATNPRFDAARFLAACGVSAPTRDPGDNQ